MPFYEQLLCKKTGLSLAQGYIPNVRCAPENSVINDSGARGRGQQYNHGNETCVKIEEIW